MKLIVLLALGVVSVSSKKLGRYDKDYTWPGKGFPAAYDKFPGTEEGAPQYDRDMPQHFANEDADDMFMNSMIAKYAKEGRNKDGSKNGKFYLEKDEGFRAA